MTAPMLPADCRIDGLDDTRPLREFVAVAHERREGEKRGLFAFSYGPRGGRPDVAVLIVTAREDVGEVVARASQLFRGGLL